VIGKPLGPAAAARLTGVSTDTLRHYEKLGLLPAVARTSGGYRRYSPETVERVRLIQRALVIGFTLKELAGVLRQRDRGEPPCGRVRSLVADRLAGLERRLEELTVLRDEMRVLIQEWDARLARTPPGQRARLLDMLTQRHLVRS
jgi:MerR family transcriptional regulator, copper efflux regulator